MENIPIPIHDHFIYVHLYISLYLFYLLNKKMKAMLNGAISGAASTFLNVPFQVIRTSMMVKQTKKGKKMSMISMMLKIYKQEGIFGFYRGLLPSLIRLPLGNAFYFSTLEYTKQFLKTKLHTNEITTNFLSSAAGIAVQCVVTNPMYVASTRFEALGFNQYSNLFDGLKHIYRDEGLRGFTKGLKPLMIKEIPSHAFFYVIYELNNKWLCKVKLFPGKTAYSVSAMLSSTIITILDNPLDLIRTRTQYQFISKNKDHKYPSIFKGIQHIYKTEGLRGLQNGVMPRILRKIFSTTVLWTVYEVLNKTKKNKKEKI